MTVLSWFPEQVPPWGAFTARGLRGVLGRPKQHPLAILVRETAQNSWDARLPERQVGFSVDGFEFTRQQIDQLRTEVFAETPPLGLRLASRVAAGNLGALIVRDSGTHGLGGPTRADEAREGQSNRYARLLLDIGVASRTEIDGGTYGFGRSIAYNVSGVQTVLYYTRTRDQLPDLESRLIVAALGEEYTYQDSRFTGRHWWGYRVRDSVEPVVGEKADLLAAAVGFRPFRGDETGTALMILDPLLRTPDPERAMAFIAESLTWNLWPKMIPTRGRHPMLFSVSWNGTNIPVPDPLELQPLPGYVRALEVLRDADEPLITADGIEVIEIRATRPNTRLGWLAVSRFPFRHRHPSVSLEGNGEGAPPVTAAPFETNSSHVVLLRKPELVVSYNQYAALPDANVEWAGVFLASPDHNEAFALAEPPAHDSWEPGFIDDKSKRRIVNIALREIRRSVNSRYQPVNPTPGLGGGLAVARIANALGPLFSGVPGGGAGVKLGNGGGIPTGGGNRRRPRVKVTQFGPVMESGERASEVRFSVIPAAGTDETTVRLVVDVAIGDGSTVEGTDRPVGAATPMLLSVQGPTPVTGVRGYSRVTFAAHGSEETSWRVLSTASDDMLVSFSIDAEAASRGSQQ